MAGAHGAWPPQAERILPGCIPVTVDPEGEDSMHAERMMSSLLGRPGAGIWAASRSVLLLRCHRVPPEQHAPPWSECEGPLLDDHALRVCCMEYATRG